MRNYFWPGNVRELENYVYRLLTDYPGERISPEHLDGRFFDSAPASITTIAELKDKFGREEREHITRALRHTRSKAKAAELLGVAPTTLHSIMKRVGLYFHDSD